MMVQLDGQCELIYCSLRGSGKFVESKWDIGSQDGKKESCPHRPVEFYFSAPPNAGILQVHWAFFYCSF